LKHAKQSLCTFFYLRQNMFSKDGHVEDHKRA
jgi:hypothetical protein